MSTLGTFASLLGTKAVAGAAAAGLAVAGAAGLQLAQEKVAESPAELLEIPADERAHLRGDNADRGEDDGFGATATEEDAELAITEEVGTEDLEVEGDDQGRAAEVHAALTTSDEHPEGLTPGDEGFGQAVADNARNGAGFGRTVAATASEGRSEEGRQRGEEGRQRGEEGRSEEGRQRGDEGRQRGEEGRQRGEEARAGAGQSEQGTQAEAGVQQRPDAPADSGRPEGTPPAEGAASEDGLETADEARSAERPAGRSGR
jgi:transcription termination factor Rho